MSWTMKFALAAVVTLIFWVAYWIAEHTEMESDERED